MDDLGNIRTASAGYGDIPFHMTQVSKFAFQESFDFNEPIFDGERLRYPFFINLLSGILLRLGATWFVAMQAVAFSLVFGGTILTFIFYKSILKSALASAIAVLIFLLGSGFGSIYVFAQSNAGSVGEFIDFTIETTASTISKWDAVYPEQNIGWGAPLSLVFLHQRSFLLGFFMFSLFLFLFEKWQKNQKDNKWALLLGLTVGLTPLSHYHSFVAMCVVLGLFAVSSVLQNGKKAIFNFLKLGFVVTVLALPQIFYLIQGKSGILATDNSFLKLRLGWMTEPTIGSMVFKQDGNFFENMLAFSNYIFINFGVVLPMFLLATFFFLKLNDVHDRFLNIRFWAICGLCLFLLVQIIRFQPWDYDNNKILVYFQYFAAPTIVAFFLWVEKYMKKIGWILLALFTVLAIHSGVIDEIPRALVPVDELPVIFNSDAVATADFIKDSIPEGEKIITTSTHLNPVNSLAGKPALVGYPGWLWTRGINYGEREQNLKLFYQDPGFNKNIPYLYGARYALVDPSAVYDWSALNASFDNNFELVFRKGNYSLYKLY